jgi:hypothetical protein
MVVVETAVGTAQDVVSGYERRLKKPVDEALRVDRRLEAMQPKHGVELLPIRARLGVAEGGGGQRSSTPIGVRSSRAWSSRVGSRS